ncbi:MAG: heme o synthase [Gemmatimonadota bacterium]|nr:heme o synthase [Gemmatimonadota bacterium]
MREGATTVVGLAAADEKAGTRESTSTADWIDLTKPRIATLVTVTAAVGYVMGSAGPVDFARLVIALVGTALAAGGAGALNHVVERDVDAKMRRTKNRPVPAGRVDPNSALAYGLSLSALGLTLLWFGANPWTSILGLLTILLYIGVYTPLKKVTPLNTLVGAVPGAIPPVMGWMAASGGLDWGAVVLFSILFLWQLPHFLSIAWMYREDYARGGLEMLPTRDPDGKVTGRVAATYGLALVPVSLAPTPLGLAGGLYFFGAIVLGFAFFGFAVALAVKRDRRRARRVLLASVTYLPALLTLLVIDRVAV